MRGLGRVLANRLDHRLVKRLHDSQVNASLEDRELHTAGELQDGVCEVGSIAFLASRLSNGPCEFFIDHPLQPFQSTRSCERTLP